MYAASAHPSSQYVLCREPDVHAQDARISVDKLPRSDGHVMLAAQISMSTLSLYILLHAIYISYYLLSRLLSHLQRTAVSLPSSSCSQCGGLLRPHVVWFGEPLEVPVMDRAQQILRESDLCLLVREPGCW